MESAGLLPISYSHVHCEFIMYLWVEAVGSDICPNASEDRVCDMVNFTIRVSWLIKNENDVLVVVVLPRWVSCLLSLEKNSI